MLVKVKHNGTTLQFDSTRDDIAILLTPKDREAIDKMRDDQMLIVSAPLKSMRDRSAEVWSWAYTDWKGATFINHQPLVPTV